MQSKCFTTTAKLSLIGFILLSSNFAYANAVQKFTGLNFSNPAELGKVKDEAMVIGDKYNNATIKYTGSAAAGTGTAYGHAKTMLPYFRFAKRIDGYYGNNVVVGLDITEPFSANDVYSKTSIAAGNATLVRMSSVDIAPNVAININKDWSFGLGLDALYQKFGNNLMVPGFLGGGQATLNVDAWGWGWHAGIFYSPNECTGLGLSYYSKITEAMSGTGTLPGFPTTGARLTLTMPTTASFNIYQKVNPQWTVLGSVNRTWWHFNTFYIYNSSLGDLAQQVDFRNTWRVALNNLYDIDCQWGVWFGASYDQGPTVSEFRTIGVEALDSLTLLLGGRYHATKSMVFDGFLTHGWSVGSNNRTNLPNPPFMTVGKFDTWHTGVELRMSWDLNYLPM